MLISSQNDDKFLKHSLYAQLDFCHKRNTLRLGLCGGWPARNLQLST